METLRGKNAQGTWTLHVFDDAASSAGLDALVEWSLLVDWAAEPIGNVNFDADVDAADIDMVYANLGSNDAAFDLDHDGDTDREDVDELVSDILGKRYGDTDLDQDVDLSDFDSMAVNYDPSGLFAFHSWSQGNFDGDGDVDISDFRRLITNFAPGGYSMSVGSRSVAASSTATVTDVIPLAAPVEFSSGIVTSASPISRRAIASGGDADRSGKLAAVERVYGDSFSAPLYKTRGRVASADTTDLVEHASAFYCRNKSGGKDSSDQQGAVAQLHEIT